MEDVEELKRIGLDVHSFNEPATASQIAYLFRFFLGRDADDDYISGLIHYNTTILQVIHIFVRSPEFINGVFASNNVVSPLHLSATAGGVRDIFAATLQREPEDEYVQSLIDTNASLFNVLQIIMNSNELKRVLFKRPNASDRCTIDDYEFCIPRDLRISPDTITRVLLIGSCLLEAWHGLLGKNYSGIQFEYITFNNASVLPDAEIVGPRNYDFHLLQIPLRSILPEATYFQIKFSDNDGYRKLFDDCCIRLQGNLRAILKYHRECGMLSFVLNFCPPQQNPLGRMQNRYDLSNIVYFIEQLNVFLYRELQKYNDVHVIDFDQIASIFGRKYVGEDLVFVTSHGAVLVDIESKFDESRIEPLGSSTVLYGANSDKYIIAAFEEACAMYRTIKQTDNIKLVILDLDDTLWRGVAAEKDSIDPSLVEGWPLGIVEALSYLWRRGIMLAIVSKNDRANVERIWVELYGDRFGLDKFVAIEANWSPKAENIRKILQSVNLLANSVLFVDDNPIERAAVKSAFPEIRTLEAPVVSWRRVLLWSTETQRSAITDEAGERTEMVQAQIRREEARASHTHEEFLASLKVELNFSVVQSRSDKRFDRSFELLNKSNQFNTTGVRWTTAELQSFFEVGGYLIAVEVKDKYTNYGLTGVLVIDDTVVRQFVLSCRVFGLGVEKTSIAWTKSAMKSRGVGTMEGLIIVTEKNNVSRSIFQRCGFSERADGIWELETSIEIRVPEHVCVRQCF